MHDCSIHIFGFGGETMDDVRHAAEERAARPKKAPVGSSFESERQREKNALVRQLDAQDGRNVHKISAAPEIPEAVMSMTDSRAQIQRTVRASKSL